MAQHTAERLRDASFIRVKGAINDPEVHAIVMEFVDWPTLADEMKRHPRGCLPPQYVVKVLAKISVAQQDAHKIGEQIGALSPTSVYVNPEGDVRLTPFRIEGQLARGLTMSTGQLVNWDILTMLTPEIYRGHQPKTREELDAHEQYYLGLLGLELLMAPAGGGAVFRGSRAEGQVLPGPAGILRLRRGRRQELDRGVSKPSVRSGQNAVRRTG